MVDFEEDLELLVVAGSAFAFALVFEVAFAGLAVTLGSLTSFFSAVLFVVSLASLVVVVRLAAGFFAAGDFVTLAAMALVLSLTADLTDGFLVEVDLEVFVGLFWSRH